MVKGQYRRFVVVRGTGKRLFEEAIFILREDVEKAGGYTAEDIVREAEIAAQEYIQGGGGHRALRRLVPVVSGAAGMLAGAMIWMMMGW